MSLLRRTRLFLLFSAAGLCNAANVVVLGDSLSDGGYFLGARFTDPGGDLWHEYLADRMGLSRATTTIFGISGLNLAVGGSLVSDLQAQVNRFASRYTWQSGDLCTVWIGGNDIRGNPAQDMTALASSVGDIVAQLAGLGVDHFIVPNLPDIGAIPESLGTPGAATRTAGTVAFNTALAAEMGARATALGVTIEQLDIFNLFGHIDGFATDYGFTNTTEPLEDNPGGEPSEYVFWDDIHPTTRSHFLVSGSAQALADPNATIEFVSLSLGTDGSLRQTWLADPGSNYDILSAADLQLMAPVANFSGSPAYTAEVAAPSASSGFYQTRRN